MKQYSKDMAATLFPDNKAAQTKFKSMVQGCALAKKPLEAENDEEIIAKVLAKCTESPKRAFNKRLMDAVKDAKKYITEDEIIEAINSAYKEKVNEKTKQQIEQLKYQIEILESSLK